jgi:hypothetical protein
LDNVGDYVEKYSYVQAIDWQCGFCKLKMLYMFKTFVSLLSGHASYLPTVVIVYVLGNVWTGGGAGQEGAESCVTRYLWYALFNRELWELCNILVIRTMLYWCEKWIEIIKMELWSVARCTLCEQETDGGIR